LEKVYGTHHPYTPKKGLPISKWGPTFTFNIDNLRRQTDNIIYSIHLSKSPNRHLNKMSFEDLLPYLEDEVEDPEEGPYLTTIQLSHN
jgi:hypothetical protein